MRLYTVTGIAMATPRGLVVPVIKQVQRKSIADIASELSALQVLVIYLMVMMLDYDDDKDDDYYYYYYTNMMVMFDMLYECNK